MRSLIIAMLGLSISGCTTSSLMSDRAEAVAIPDSNATYLVGGFVSSYWESAHRLAIELDCSGETSSIYIELERPIDSSKIDLFPIQPGTCELENLVQMGGWGGIGQKGKLNQDFTVAPFDSKPGTIYYLGHYDGYSTSQVSPGGTMIFVRSGMGLSISKQPLSQIKESISDLYPAFAELPIVDVSPAVKDSE